jgi:hypothetical protein
MYGLVQHETRHIVSEIDIQLWAREQRRLWFARTCGAPFRKFALRSWVIFRLIARGWFRRLLQFAPSRRDSGAQSGYHGPVATSRKRVRPGPSLMLRTGVLGR